MMIPFELVSANSILLQNRRYGLFFYCFNFILQCANVFDEQAIQEEFFERVDNPLQVFEKQIDDLETINNMLMSFINVVVNAIKEHEELMQKNVDELEEEFNRKFIRKDDCETNKRK